MDRRFMDRDFIETIEGLILCVVGNIHPKDRVISYLKYIPGVSASKIKWIREEVSYKRILPYYSAEGVGHVMSFMEKKFPQYVVYDEVFGIKFIEIPLERIRIHYKPEERLREILGEARDPLERMVRQLAILLSKEANISLNAMGISGSILLKMHDPKYSDIDLLVYGRSNALKVKQALLDIYSREGHDITRPVKIVRSWIRGIVKTHPLTLKEAELLYHESKWNRALFKGRPFSVHPIKLPEELNEEYGDRIFRGIGMAKILAEIHDSSDSIFLPATYIVENVQVIKGPRVKDIREITSYEGIYCDIAEEGERVVAYGKLERVIDKRRDEKYYRLLIGSFEARGKDYIKPLRWSRLSETR